MWKFLYVYKKNNGFENQTRAQLKTVLLNLSENSYCIFAYISQLAEFLVVSFDLFQDIFTV